jgi:peptidoglycan/xylan/chitin deacetylase (PgdA/CDA1 family)
MMIEFNPIYFVPTIKNSISITFDDGPTPGVTDRLLDLLQEKKAKATFFMVGEEIIKHHDLAERVCKEGHEIGVHSYRHKKKMKTWDVPELVKDFNDTIKAIKDHIGIRPKIIRTPYGNICSTIIQACQECKLEYAGWSMWVERSSDKLSRLEQLSVPGSVVLFHDGGRINENNANKVVDLVSELLDKKDFSFETFSSLTSQWDDNQVVNHIDGLRLLGNAQCIIDGRVESNLFWHQADCLAGIRGNVYCPSHEIVASFLIHPMSNITDWLIPLNASVTYPNFIRTFDYNGEKNEENED